MKVTKNYVFIILLFCSFITLPTLTAASSDSSISVTGILEDNREVTSESSKNNFEERVTHRKDYQLKATGEYVNEMKLLMITIIIVSAMFLFIRVKRKL